MDGTRLPDDDRHHCKYRAERDALVAERDRLLRMVDAYLARVDGEFALARLIRARAALDREDARGHGA